MFQGFEGVLLGKRTDGATEDMAVPTSRVLTQINNGGGVLHIQQVHQLILLHIVAHKRYPR